jgi:hypothetical protein
VGASGGGKSSLMLGGLVPALQAGALPGSQDWRYLEALVPGSDPLLALAALTRPPLTPAAEWDQQAVAELRRDPDFVLNSLQAGGDTPAVVVVDQLEELFTLCGDEAVRQVFVDNLARVAQAPHADHRLLLTLRSDFVEYVARLQTFHALFRSSEVHVVPLDAAELREAIQRPADMVGLKFDEGIVDDLVEQILGEPAGLPLLQFTLLKLWEARERNRVTWQTYRRVGGPRVALARSADALYERLIPEEQLTLKRILLRLARPSERIEVTSNRVRCQALYQAGEARERVDSVLQKLIDARLVRRTSGDLEQDDQVEVAHEALIRNWPRLVDWLTEERAALVTLRRLDDRARAWQARGRQGDLLDETETPRVEQLLADAELAALGYDESLPIFVAASRRTLDQAREQKEALLRRLRYWHQGAGAAVGAGVGWGLLLVVVAVGGGRLFSNDGPPAALLVFLIVAIFMLGLVLGQANGIGIGVGLWLWGRHPVGRIATVISSTLTGSVAYACFLALVPARPPANEAPFVGACLGAGLGLGAASSRLRLRRLMGTTAGATLAMVVVWVAGWQPLLNGPTALVGGLALGLATGLGLYLTAADDDLSAR